MYAEPLGAGMHVGLTSLSRVISMISRMLRRTGVSSRQKSNVALRRDLTSRQLGQ